MLSVARTVSAFLLCVGLLLISGKLFNILPAILFFPILFIYYQQAMLWYFVFACDDIFSTILGAILSVSYIVLYYINFTTTDSIAVKITCIIAVLLGIGQTFKSILLRVSTY